MATSNLGGSGLGQHVPFLYDTVTPSQWEIALDVGKRSRAEKWVSPEVMALFSNAVPRSVDNSALCTVALPVAGPALG